MVPAHSSAGEQTPRQELRVHTKVDVPSPQEEDVELPVRCSLPHGRPGKPGNSSRQHLTPSGTVQTMTEGEAFRSIDEDRDCDHSATHALYPIVCVSVNRQNRDDAHLRTTASRAGARQKSDSSPLSHKGAAYPPTPPTLAVSPHYPPPWERERESRDSCHVLVGPRRWR